MFLPCSRLDGRNDLPRDAQLRKGPERRQLIISKVADRLVETNHAFLNNILAVCANQKIGSSLGSYEVPVFID